ncbi:MAG: phosphate acetyltransferase [Oscillospiraceae bacterium]|nr:phosphate acetyltransferase [Oscillospiraceae bacterium]
MNAFLNDIISRAKRDIKTIVLPEGSDARVAQASLEIERQGFAKVIVLGDNLPKKEEYAQELFKNRQHKGLSLDEARSLIENPLYYGTMMVKTGDADGMVAGACHCTGDVLRPALQILKTGSGLVSALFFVLSPNAELGNNGAFIFADCALNPNPTAEQLAEIAIDSARTYKQFFGAEAKIAMLSYSTFGSGKGDSVEKVRTARSLAIQKEPSLIIDGELQLDAAIIPEVSNIKSPDSKIQGSANVLIFPDLQSGNIGYKIAERFGNCLALGPILQGLSNPVNDLSRGCSVEDIVGVAAITAVQAQNSI